MIGLREADAQRKAWGASPMNCAGRNTESAQRARQVASDLSPATAGFMADDPVGPGAYAPGFTLDVRFADSKSASPLALALIRVNDRPELIRLNAILGMAV